MRKKLSFLILSATVVLGMYSCQKEATTADESAAIPESVSAAITKAGFSTENIIRDGSGYIVEGDIYNDDNYLRVQPGWFTMTIAATEQYRTTNLVTGLPRTITVSVNSKMGTAYQGDGGLVDDALQRYNAQNLEVTFDLVPSNGDIEIVNANGSYLASAGFPTGGEPYGQVKVNSRSLKGQPDGTIVSVIAHELGHCIGFRHTDYMDRSYSCGGAPSNEGSSGVGAILIPGTPSGADAGSWMLSCIGSGQNRPFNANDVTALKYLY